MPVNKILFWWDVEDYINPASDDALLLILREFKKRNMAAVLKLVGRKTRVLLERRRSDIIELMKDDLFEIGYHTESHSAHPTIAEYTEPCDWRSGVAEILRRESDGADITRRTFGKELACYGQPGSSYTPFAYGVLRDWGIPAYLGISVALGDSLFPSEINGIFNPAGLWSAVAAFSARKGDEAAAEARTRIDDLLSSLPEGSIISHANHPNEWSLEQWWDEVNFRDGASPEPEHYKPAPLVPRAEMVRRVGLFGRYLDWIASRGLHAVSLREMMSLFTSGGGSLTRRDVEAVAQSWSKGEADLFVDAHRHLSLSAGQCLYVLAAAVARPRAASFPVLLVSAPVYLEGLAADQTLRLSGAGVEALARTLVSHVERSGSLPARIQAPGGGLAAPAVLGVALARYLLHGGDKVEAGPVVFKPAAAVRKYGEGLDRWSIHRAGFNPENLHRYSQLLSWSYRSLFAEVR